MKQPDPKIMCHKSGMRKSCHKLVTAGRCNRWQELELKLPKTGTVETIADCIDNLDFVMKQLQLIKTDEVNASVDELRKESHKREENGYAVQAHALGAMAQIAQRIETVAEQTSQQLEHAVRLSLPAPEKPEDQLQIEFQPSTN